MINANDIFGHAFALDASQYAPIRIEDIGEGDYAVTRGIALLGFFHYNPSGDEWVARATYEGYQKYFNTKCEAISYLISM